VRKSVVVTLGALTGVGAGLALASWRWRSVTAALVSRLRSEAAREPAVWTAEPEALPAPVARFFRAVLPQGGTALRSARLEQRGQFLARPGADGWRRFTAVEHFSARPPGFVWDADIRMAPGLTVRVRDGFVSGRGSMVASVLGIYPVVAAEGSPELGAAALQRFLAEGVWIPTALLPQEGIRWSSLDQSSARATVTVGTVTASVDFHFDAAGLVERIFTAARGRDAGGGRIVPTPWQGRFSGYELRDGYRIPTRGEVEWLMPDGPAPYWRGEITGATFERRAEHTAR
jgi:uncharacterized protein DUF6920